MTWLAHNMYQEYFGTGYDVVHKFGRNLAVPTSFVGVSVGGLYLTPQVAAATNLRVKAGNTNDTAAGSGARGITLLGLDETGAEVEETLATAGVSASSTTSATFIRLYRAYVSTSGTYGTTTAGSHAADIVIENGAGGTDWLTIDSTGYPRGQSEVAFYSVPLGKTAYVTSIQCSVQSNKTADIVMVQRRDILDAAVPYQAMRTVLQLGAVAGHASLRPATPFGPFPALTDIGFLSKGAAVSEVDVNFEIVRI